VSERKQEPKESEKDTERFFWFAIRRALLAIVHAIDARFGPTKETE
jgi:hypothetical protein